MKEEETECPFKELARRTVVGVGGGPSWLTPHPERASLAQTGPQVRDTGLGSQASLLQYLLVSESSHLPATFWL